ncbi:MAG TPA: hypothetical protein VMG30_01470 [Acidobacteriota bacterium]|nr:hypothetical protein [Acidobacteriota bacterium]
MNSPCWKYRYQLFGALVLYSVIVWAAFFVAGHLSAPWKYVIAALPMLPALYFAILVTRTFREMDELQKKIQLEALAFGFTAAAILTLGYGFLQHAGLPEANWVWVWPVMGGCLIAGKLIAKRRYR